jgi:Uma2 family endonuclease
VVEVTSPSTARLDKTSKLSDYLAIDSIAHYLILDPVSREVIHHRRIDGKRFVTQAIRTGALTLDPPGLTVAIEDIFGANTHASS